MVPQEIPCAYQQTIEGNEALPCKTVAALAGEGCQQVHQFVSESPIDPASMSVRRESPPGHLQSPALSSPWVSRVCCPAALPDVRCRTSRRSRQRWWREITSRAPIRVRSTLFLREMACEERGRLVVQLRKPLFEHGMILGDALVCSLQVDALGAQAKGDFPDLIQGEKPEDAFPQSSPRCAAGKLFIEPQRPGRYRSAF